MAAIQPAPVSGHFWTTGCKDSSGSSAIFAFVRQKSADETPSKSNLRLAWTDP